MVSFGDLAPQDTLPALPARVLAAGREAVAAGTPVALVSECTLVPPLLAAVRERHPDVALVWIDAHGDLNTPDTTPSGFLGGMPFAQLLGWCFDDWRRQAGLEPPLPEQRAVLVGGRDLDPGERDERRPLAAARGRRRRGRARGAARGRAALRARGHRRARPEPDARRGLSRPGRLERRAHARGGRRARGERPRRRASRSARAHRPRSTPRALAPLVDALR